jgi:hypothetical protein
LEIMSSLTITPALVRKTRTTRRSTRPTRRPKTAVRLTRRGRIVFVLAFLALAAALMTAFGGLATATRDAGTPEPVRIVEVGPGDTLYGIAGTVARPGEVREMVHHIQQLNSLSGSGLSVGQRLAVPVQ